MRFKDSGFGVEFGELSLTIYMALVVEFVEVIGFKYLVEDTAATTSMNIKCSPDTHFLTPPSHSTRNPQTFRLVESSCRTQTYYS
jgi:hypothetical protein